MLASSDKSRHLIEVLPYNYTCRRWHGTAAACAGVEYHAVVDKELGADARLTAGIGRCWAEPTVCATLGCHDMLRDQAVGVEMDVFRDTWLPIRNRLDAEWGLGAEQIPGPATTRDNVISPPGPSLELDPVMMALLNDSGPGG
jgi:hypothetical protein